jgi:methionyl-tRNA synthetase
MKEIRSILSLDDRTLTLESAQRFFELEAGTMMSVDKPVFPRFDTKATAGPKAEKKTKEADDDAGLLDISEFSRFDLRVAEVIEAEKLEGADRLLKLQIDLGGEKRQIVAGVAQQYNPEQITGMKIIVVTNLKPAVIRGVESNGMLLAARKGKILVLLTPDSDLPAGAKVS